MSQVCSTCKKLRNKKDLKYDPKTLKTICRSCEKGTSLVPFSIDSLKEEITNHHNEEAIAAIEKTLGKTASFRPTAEQSHYLALLAQENAFTNVQQALHYILNKYMESNAITAELKENLFAVDNRALYDKPEEIEPKPKPEPKPEPKPKPKIEPKPPKPKKKEVIPKPEEDEILTL